MSSRLTLVSDSIEDVIAAVDLDPLQRLLDLTKQLHADRDRPVSELDMQGMPCPRISDRLAYKREGSFCNLIRVVRYDSESARTRLSKSQTSSRETQSLSF